MFTLGCEATGYLNDGTRAYRRYRDASGKDLEVEYERAYREDEGIQKAVDDEVAAAICQAIALAKKNGNCKQSLSLRSKASRLAESKTDNWRKALGGHRIWGQGTLKYDPSTGTWTIELEVEMEDFYNFNKGQEDIATGIPDDVNGRFETCGWAKSFFSRGKLKRTVSWKDGHPPVDCDALAKDAKCGSGPDRDRTRDRSRDRGRRGRDLGRP